MKKILLFLGLTFSLLNAEPEIILSEEEAKELTSDTLQKEPEQYMPFSINTGNELVSCTLTPFTRTQAKELFGNADSHTDFFPIKVTITNNSTQKLVIPNPFEEFENPAIKPQQYLHFKNYTLESTFKILKIYNKRFDFGLLTHIGFISIVGFLTATILPLGVGLCFENELSKIFPKCQRLSLGSMLLVMYGFFSKTIISDYFEEQRITKAYNTCNDTIREFIELNQDNGLAKSSNHKKLIIPAKSSFNDLLFIDSSYFPSARKKLTDQPIPLDIAQLQYELI
jgi:hypothetical protein